MKITQSRNKREGKYAGKWNGMRFRYRFTFGCLIPSSYVAHFIFYYPRFKPL